MLHLFRIYKLNIENVKFNLMNEHKKTIRNI